MDTPRRSRTYLVNSAIPLAAACCGSGHHNTSGQGSTSPYSLWPSCLRRSTEACPSLGAIGVSVCAATPGLWCRQPDCSGSRLVGAVNMLIPRRRAIGQPVKKRPSSAQGRNHRYGSPAEHRSRPRRRGRRVVLEQRTRRRTPARFGMGGRAARRPPPSVPGTAIDRREHKASGYFADSAVAVAVRHRGG